ncbi:MAG: dihydropteroate synthase [Rhodospirillaceae bacterium]|nr:dihydropteroate synthase [Rhodospirillaceae bacterium]
MTKVAGGLPPPKSLGGIPASNLYCVPRGICAGDTASSLVGAGHGLPLLGSRHAFAAVEFVVRESKGVTKYAASVTAFNPWRQILNASQQARIASLLEAVAKPRPHFAGLSIDKPAIMGIVNVTPDSFSDGGDHATTERAVQHGESLAGAGAVILDVGGESTRPGAQLVDAETEQRRVVPVVRALAEKGFVISVDTRNASTMSAALAAGAKIVNDVTALTRDTDALKVVVKHKAAVILMHMQGEPQTMQSAPSYDWVVGDVFDYLSERVDACLEAGMELDSICVDPGIGFGKSDIHNGDIINALSMFHGLGCALMLGASRKSFIGRLTDTENPKARVSGSIAAALAGAAQGVSILRVHDVSETHQALNVWQYQA